jgi:hypothetical protein
VTRRVERRHHRGGLASRTYVLRKSARALLACTVKLGKAHQEDRAAAAGRRAAVSVGSGVVETTGDAMAMKRCGVRERARGGDR